MALNGIRYAVDIETKAQYIIFFTHGEITNITPVFTDENDLQSLRGKTITAVDDEIINDSGTETRLAYKLTFDKSGSFSDYKIGSKENINEALPSQHPGGVALLARNVLDIKSNAPTNPLRDIISAKKADPTNNNQPIARPVTRKPIAGTKITVTEQQIESLLEKYGVDLTERAYQGSLDPVIGRQDEVKKLKQYLLRKKRSNVNLVGDAGVGKTVMFDALAQDIADGNAEEELSNARVISLNLQDMNAGTKYRGDFEKKLVPILKGLEQRGGYLKGQKIILCLDEIHSALTAGKADGGTDAAEIMKPYLSSGAISCIGATTPAEYKKFIEKNKALDRRFQRLQIDPPNSEDTVKILMGLRETYQKKHHDLDAVLDDAQLEQIVKLTDRYMLKANQPDKAIGIMDDASAIARMDGRKEVTSDDIISSVAKASGMSIEFIGQSDEKKFLTLEKDLPSTVLGQDESMKEIVDHLISARSGLGNPNQPWGVFLEQGPTGVGKTFTAEVLAEKLGMNLIRLDMANYSEKHHVSSLTGAPPGYVGHEDAEAELTEPVRQNPHSILLLDEVEKAHKDVFNLLLSAIDKGEIKDQKGRVVSFRNTIIIMTSNLGSEEVHALLKGGNTIGLVKEQDQEKNLTSDDMKEKISTINKRAREKFFKPEFLNRIESVGACLDFHNLKKENINKLVMVEVNKLGQRLRESVEGVQLKNVELAVSDKVKDALAEKGYNPVYGARPMQTAVQKHISRPLGRWLLENKADVTEKSEKGPVQLVINDLDNFKPIFKAVAAKTPKDKVPVAANSNTRQTQKRKPRNNKRA